MLKKLFLLICICIAGFSAHSIENRDILQNQALAMDLEEELVQSFAELHFPDYDDRNFWNALPETIMREYISSAEQYLEYDWPVVKATDYLEIIRSGDRKQEVYAAPRNALLALIMGELAEGKGRFLDQIVNGVWYYSEQTWWGWSAHLTLQAAPHGLPDIKDPVIDLGVGEIANILSWTYYLFREPFDDIHPLISVRLKKEIMHKAVIPYYEREDLWWMGFDGSRTVNNWNPWTNHNMLTAILIMEDDRAKKLEGVRKVIRSLDVFLNGYPADGGCDEGPSYWGRAGASLYQCLDLLRRSTNGKFDVFENQLIGNIGTYIYKAYIDYPYFINFADADATTGSRPSIIYQYGKDIGDPVMWKFGAYLAEKQGWGTRTPGGKIDEQIMQLMCLDEIRESEAENALIKDFWLSDTEVAGARGREGSAQGFFFAAKGGHNAESHNHNDVGTCILYYDGKPCLIDLGRETYVAKTFSSRRYEIWTMQSQYHNLPVINGQDQAPGSEYKAKTTTFRANDRMAEFSAEISGAYPPEAFVESWVRTYRLNRGKNFIIRDDFELNKHTILPTTVNLMTYCSVERISPGKLHLEGPEFELDLLYDSRHAGCTIEFIEVTDRQLKQYWPKGVARIVLEWKGEGLKGKNEIQLRKSE